MITTLLQKMPNNVGNLGKIIVATGFEWLPKVQKIAKSGHTDHGLSTSQRWLPSTPTIRVRIPLCKIFCLKRAKINKKKAGYCKGKVQIPIPILF